MTNYTDAEVVASREALVEAIKASGIPLHFAGSSGDELDYVYEHGGKQYLLTLGMVDDAIITD